MQYCFTSDGTKKCKPLPQLPKGTLKPNSGNISQRMKRSLQLTIGLRKPCYQQLPGQPIRICNSEGKSILINDNNPNGQTYATNNCN